MPADTMELAYGVIGEIGADVADITIPGETTRQLHLPGADILLLAGLTVVSAFFRGLLTGIVAETSQTGEDLGRGLVRRFTGLLHRLAPGAAGPAGSNGTVPGDGEPGGDTGGDGDRDGDVVTDFRQAAADAEAALTRLGVVAGALEQYAAGAQAEVAAALRSLGLRDERIQILAPATTTRLIGQVHTDLTAT
ncbi:MAG TPA: hypothetical protein VGQ05_23180 [Streptosporangiaceae bacterium]|jgi:hypothetical protein|nr:hypothetical protein [Streptosporangiaceae bacterium]